MTTPLRDAAVDEAPVPTGSVLAIRGGRPLSGRVDVKGAKNLATKAMVAALLGEGPSVLRNVPDISDVRVVRGLLEVHGVKVTNGAEEGELLLDPSAVESAHMADIDAHAGSSRIPILFCGPLLHRLGEAFIPDLGGCRIGDRPIDYHLEVLRKFGAEQFTMGEGTDPSTGTGWAGVEFVHADVLVRLRAHMRPATDDVIAEHARTTKTKRLTPDAFERLEADRVWRVLVWTIKARLVAVTEGLESFEQAFLAHLVDPSSGRTLWEGVRGHIEAGALALGGAGIPALGPGGPR